MDHANHSMGMDVGMDMNMGMDMDKGMVETMTMTMYFYQSEKVKFLFDGFETSSSVGYFGACMLAVFFGFMTELLSIFQDKLEQQISSKIKEE